MADVFAGLGESNSSFEPLDLSAVEEVLFDYAKQFQKMASRQLRQSNKISSGALEESIAFEVTDTGDGYELALKVLDYYKFVDQGVRGAGSNSRNKTSPYKYRNKMPPVKEILKWISQKGSLKASAEDQRRGLSKAQKSSRALRGATQRIKPKTLAFLIARKIQQRGLPYTGFWERSFEQTFKGLDVKLAQVTGLNIRTNFEQLIKEIKSR
jgi:hypothetical protein